MRPLNSSEYVTNTFTANSNVQYTTATGSVTATGTISSLTMSGTAASTLTVNSGVNLNIKGGAIVAGTGSGSPNYTISGSGKIYFPANNATLPMGSTGSVTTEGFIHVMNNSLTLGVPIAGSGTTMTAVVKDGSGNLTLTASNTYLGGTYLDAGTLTLGAAAALSSQAPLYLNGGTLTSSVSTTLGEIIAGVGPHTIAPGRILALRGPFPWGLPRATIGSR